MVAGTNPVPVTPRQLIAVLRREASAFAPSRRVRDLMADIAARDLVESGKVRLVAGPGHRRAA